MHRLPARPPSSWPLVLLSRAAVIAAIGVLAGCDDETLTDGSSSGTSSGTGGGGGAKACVERTVYGTFSSSLATRGESVFFVRRASDPNEKDALVRADLEADETSIVLEAKSIGPFATSGDDVFLAVGAEIIKVRFDGGPSSVVVATVPGARINQIAVDHGAITWVEDTGELRRFQSGITTTFPGSFGALVQAPGVVMAYASNGYLHRVEGSGTSLVQGFEGVPFLVHDGGVFSILYSVDTPTAPFVRLDLATAQTTPLFTSPDYTVPREAGAVGVGDRIYAVTRGHLSGDTSSRLISFPITGGEPTVLAEVAKAGAYFTHVAKTETRLVYSVGDQQLRALCLDALQP